MFKIKICGVRQAEDIEAVRAAGADAIGLNFFPPSVRYVDPDASSTLELAKLAQAAGIRVIGLFVNPPAGDVRRVCERLALDAAQFHGDEKLEELCELKRQLQIPLIRAIKLPTGGLTIDRIEAASAAWIGAGYLPLLDADAGASHGGSGKTLDWRAIAAWHHKNQIADWVLAGGIRPENVAEAIGQSGARAIDSASGAECPKGVKNAGRIADLVARSGLLKPNAGTA